MKIKIMLFMCMGFIEVYVNSIKILVFVVFFLDECVSNFCVNGGFCVDRVDEFFCICGRGYSGDFC